MFDIGFSEILLIFVLALVVLGPEKLPRVASQVGRWVGRARGMARQFREQLEEEVTLEESRRTRPSGPRANAASDMPESPSAVDAEVHSPPQGTVASTFPPSHEPTATSAPAAVSPRSESAGADSEPVYPPTYSHAHPTDSEGRPIPSRDGRQHDWVGDLEGNDAAMAQGSDHPAYAPSHERGT